MRNRGHVTAHDALGIGRVEDFLDRILGSARLGLAIGDEFECAHQTATTNIADEFVLGLQAFKAGKKLGIVS